MSLQNATIAAWELYKGPEETRTTAIDDSYNALDINKKKGIHTRERVTVDAFMVHLQDDPRMRPQSVFVECPYNVRRDFVVVGGGEYKPQMKIHEPKDVDVVACCVEGQYSAGPNASQSKVVLVKTEYENEPIWTSVGPCNRDMYFNGVEHRGIAILYSGVNCCHPEICTPHQAVMQNALTNLVKEQVGDTELGKLSDSMNQGDGVVLLTGHCIRKLWTAYSAFFTPFLTAWGVNPAQPDQPIVVPYGLYVESMILVYTALIGKRFTSLFKTNKNVHVKAYQLLANGQQGKEIGDGAGFKLDVKVRTEVHVPKTTT